MILGKKFTVTRYNNEATKLAGLYRMSQYTLKQIRDMNADAYERLYKVIDTPNTANYVKLSDKELRKWRGNVRLTFALPPFFLFFDLTCF